MKVIILRGLPGVGKTTCYNNIFGDLFICSADMFSGYYNDSRQYIWAPEVCDAAHKWCQQNFVKALVRGYETIVVDNTNLKRKAWGFYHHLATLMNYKVCFIEFIAEHHQLEALAARNRHNVSLNSLKQMLAAWEPLPKEIAERCDVEQREVIT